MTLRKLAQHSGSLLVVHLCGIVLGFVLGCSQVSADSAGLASASSGSITFYVTEVLHDAEVARSEGTIGALEHALLSDLDGASRSIAGALYSIDRENIINALLDAAYRGVDVRVVAECENRKGSERASFDRLLAAGIPVVDDNSSFRGRNPSCPDSDGGSMHHKFFIIDGRVVWVGSTNMTWSGLNYNQNHSVRLESDSVVGAFQSEFDSLFSGLFSRNKSGGGIAAHDVGGVRLLTAFSPYHYEGLPDTRKLVLDATASAAASMRFAMFHFTDTEVRNAIVAKAGISQGAMDAVGAAYSGSQHHALCAAGIQVKVENFPGKLHHKFGVFDAGTASDPRAILGSANWTKSGFARNDESMLLVFDAEIAESVHSEYIAIYSDPANQGLECCDHSAESYNAQSPLCGDTACVCSDASDNDFDGQADAMESGCMAAFVCRP